MPASTSRKAATDPPNPEPTTIASKCSALTASAPRSSAVSTTSLWTPSSLYATVLTT